MLPFTPSTPTESPPPCYVKNTGDALLIFNAAILGKIPRITRRLTDMERQTLIRSGAVFVWNEDECPTVKRWTDSLAWSPSRISGNFLLYRETTERGVGRSTAARVAKRRPTPKARTDTDKRTQSNKWSLVGSLDNDSYAFKPGGLVKKTISLNIKNNVHHLVSYYQVDDVKRGVLQPFSELPSFNAIGIPPAMLDKSLFRYPPRVELVDGVVTYIGDSSDQLVNLPHNVATQAEFNVFPLHSEHTPPHSASSTSGYCLDSPVDDAFPDYFQDLYTPTPPPTACEFGGAERGSENFTFDLVMRETSHFGFSVFADHFGLVDPGPARFPDGTPAE